MKTRKIGEYPVLTVIEFQSHDIRFVKTGVDSWVYVSTLPYAVPGRPKRKATYSDKEIADMAGGIFSVYKPCGHGGKIRVGSPA